METQSLAVENMSCGHCVTRVKKALEAVSGIAVSDVQIGSARVEVHEPNAVDAAIRALDEAGYPARRV
jgi:copper chaperone CopZ